MISRVFDQKLLIYLLFIFWHLKGSRMRALVIVCVLALASACTNILVSKGASADGSTQVAYNADSGSLYGSLVRFGFF
jgi:hypothetical protein